MRLHFIHSLEEGLLQRDIREEQAHSLSQETTLPSLPPALLIAILPRRRAVQSTETNRRLRAHKLLHSIRNQQTLTRNRRVLLLSSQSGGGFSPRHLLPRIRRPNRPSIVRR